MTYQETIDYLFNSLPMYHRIGKAAYKADIANTVALMEHLDHPERGFRSIHVAGTNGKGSVSHFLASILHKAGYKVGLYTSPHLVDFRERIRIDGEMIPQEAVVHFVEGHRPFLESLQLSFFEMTVGLAFDYFAREKVDVAVIEVGMGGRLDSTNVIRPDLCVITNISFDHTQFLGNTLGLIAGEKAGIIKQGVPVVIGESHPETAPVFRQRAEAMEAPIVFADEHYRIVQRGFAPAGLSFDVERDGVTTMRELFSPMGGSYQLKNLATLMMALEGLKAVGYHFEETAVRQGIADVIRDTHLHGRWEAIGFAPLTICETAHNEAGITSMLQHLQEVPRKRLRIVYGCVNDKDFHHIIQMLPKEALYYVTQPSVPRGLDFAVLTEAVKEAGLSCQGGFPTCEAALQAARAEADPEDMILVTGSIFLVADAVGTDR